MSYTVVELPTLSKGHVSIKPFFDPSMSNLGLEKYGMSLHDGVFHEEQLACIEQNGIKRYVTGLNEFAPDVKMIKDPEAKEAKIKEIRNVVSQLERDLSANLVEPEDPEFWNKIKLLAPNNFEFWGKITIRCGNQPIYLDPITDPYALIKLYAIEAGGFSILAKSFDDARSRSVPPKFYLDKLIDTVSTKTEVKKLKNKALSELQKLFDKNTNKLFYVAKVVDGHSTQYKKSTPNDIIYDNMDRYINAEGVETNHKRAAQSFLDAAALDMETLKIKTLIKDATFYKFIAPKVDGFIYHIDTSIMMGRNPSDCLEFLRNPLNESVLISITKGVEKFWNL